MNNALVIIQEELVGVGVILNYIPSKFTLYSKVTIRLQNFSHSSYGNESVDGPLRIEAHVCYLDNKEEFDIGGPLQFNRSGEMLTLDNIHIANEEVLTIKVNTGSMSEQEIKRIKLKLRAEILEYRIS